MYYINKRFPNWEENNGIYLPKKKPNKPMNDSIHMNGRYKIYSVKNGIKSQIDEINNLIMSDVFYRIARAFLGYSLAAYYAIAYVAIGDDNTAVTASDTTLTNEVFRTPYVAIENSTTSTADATFYITSSDYVGDIEEIGIFCSDSATASADTGYLMSHALWEYTKTVNEELLIEYTVTMS